MPVTTNTEAIDLFNSIFQRRLGELTDHQEFMEVMKLVAYVQNDFRFFMLTSNSQADELWDLVRGCTSNVDFILKLTTEYCFHLEHHVYDAVSRKIVQVLSMHSLSTSIDDDLLERLAEEQLVEKLVTNNPWLLTLIMFTLIPSIVDIVSNITIPPKVAELS